MTDESRTYVVMAQMGACKICGLHKDLRVGVCFRCSDQVNGAIIQPGLHKLWDSRNPSNQWFYSETKQ